MNIQLSEHFTYKKLMRFTLPSIVMMVFSSVYGVVDGLFVSNFTGKTPFAAVNLIMPFLMIFGAIGFMVGTGGSALVAKTLGEGEKEKANRLFSMFILVTVIAGAAMAALGLCFLRPMARVLGAEGEMLEYCVQYGRVILPALPAMMLQNTFQSFLITAERPHMGLWVTVAAGVTNIVLDALFVAAFRWGVVGAAVATVISQIVGGVVPLIYFLRPNTSTLHLIRPRFDGRALLKACTNGASEFLSNISMSVVNMLYNFQLMRFAGEDGVAAYGVIMYVNFIFIAIFLGYSIGSAPIVGYHYGAQNPAELKNLYKKSLRLIAAASVVLTSLAVALSGVLSGIFVGYDAQLLQLTRRAFILYSLSFLFAGFNIFGSSFFTALNDGLVSAVISVLRTLVFQIAAVLLLPIWLELDGVWLAIVAAEGASLLVTAAFFATMREKYGY